MFMILKGLQSVSKRDSENGVWGRFHVAPGAVGLDLKIVKVNCYSLLYSHSAWYLLEGSSSLQPSSGEGSWVRWLGSGEISGQGV